VAMMLMALAPMLRRQRSAVPIAVGAVVLIAGALRGNGRIGRSVTGFMEPTSAVAAWRHGLHLSVRCIACGLGPTAILLVMGVMDLRAMAVVTALITLERLAPAGERVARALRNVVGGAGLFMLTRAALELTIALIRTKVPWSALGITGRSCVEAPRTSRDGTRSLRDDKRWSAHP
jgi:predicted metal-binding membrane protein